MAYEYCCGAVLYTIINNTIHYVIIEENDHHFGLPKGHMEPNETKIETAKREIKEETGINVEILTDFVQEIEYLLPNGNTKITTYFIAKFDHQKFIFDNQEILSVKLLPYLEAYTSLTYPQVKDVLDKANNYISTNKLHF